MKFWDASAVVSLLVAETGTAFTHRVLDDDQQMGVWWGTIAECTSALARLERDETATVTEIQSAFDVLDALSRRWVEIPPSAGIQRLARRLLRVHPLRSADSLQLAAALEIDNADPEPLPLISLDERLNQAARKEGLVVLAE